MTKELQNTKKLTEDTKEEHEKSKTITDILEEIKQVSHRPDQLHQESEYLPDGRGHEDFGRMGCGRTWGIY